MLNRRYETFIWSWLMQNVLTHRGSAGPSVKCPWTVSDWPGRAGVIGGTKTEQKIIRLNESLHLHAINLVLSVTRAAAAFNLNWFWTHWPWTTEDMFLLRSEADVKYYKTLWAVLTFHFFTNVIALIDFGDGCREKSFNIFTVLSIDRYNHQLWLDWTLHPEKRST